MYSFLCNKLSLVQNKLVRYLLAEVQEASSFDGVMSPGFEAAIREFGLHTSKTIKYTIIIFGPTEICLREMCVILGSLRLLQVRVRVVGEHEGQ